MKTGTIKQTATFNATPLEVYELIMDAKNHAAFSGEKVIMSRKIGGTFEAFGDYVHGYNIELVEGKKIVQAWHFAEDGWPDDHYSICTFKFEKKGTGTKLTFTQTGVPEHKIDSLKGGWKDYYWQPMKEYLKK